jgi:hypothetical protein
MENSTTTSSAPPLRSGRKNLAAEAPVYYISDRPEAYELNGEVSHAEARAIGELIAERAARHFPGIEFKVDSAWHSHQHGMERVAAYIEDHWQEWVAASRR